MSKGILVVDDNANIRHLLRVFVESKGFQVCGEAENGAEAVEKARQLQPDLILLDLTMPVMTGTEAAPILKRTIPDVKIILFTLHADGGNKAVASAVGVDLTLSKTGSIQKLGEHLKALLTPGDASVHGENRRSDPETASE
jgi:CheY-like chemotaxis protein